MASAGNALVTLFIFAIIFSPVLTCDAVRFTQRGININPLPMFLCYYCY